MAKEVMKMDAEPQPDTKNKRKWLANKLGISVSIYVDKMLPVDFEKLEITLEKGD